MPNYPFIFQLPNGDVFYAGSENATTADLRAGRILISDVNSPTGEWAWSEHQIESAIPGGSAVMYAPGKILKTGGGGGAAPGAETVDLSDFPSGEASYANLPQEFTYHNAADPLSDSQTPDFRRHYHNLTLLPDGRVVAIGGNTGGNGNAGEHYNNPCCEGVTDVEPYPCAAGVDALTSIECADGCPSECIRWNADETIFHCPATPTPTYRCSLLNGVICGCNPTSQDACEARPNCSWDTGTETCVEDMPADDFCAAAMPGAYCAGQRCRKDCTGPGDTACTEVAAIDGQCVLPTVGDGQCSPQNNTCYAVKTAEVYDPSCGEWTTLGDQEDPRMYHSTSLLLPDGRVISMGGGHRDFAWIMLEEQDTAEYFEPVYSTPGATKPQFDVPATLPWETDTTVVLESGGDELTRATLVRLGSTTHGFDMDQRFIELSFTGGPSQYDIQGVTPVETFHTAQNIAPPGYYMLFLFNEDGEPSPGYYVKVGDPDSAGQHVCEASGSLSAGETSCTAEPTGGSCPMGASRTVPVTLPRVSGPRGDVSGFYAFADYDVVHDPDDPEPHELEAVTGLCVQACEAYFAGQPGIDATCDAPGAFLTPVPFGPAHASRSLVRDDASSGQGLFAGQVLGCDLGTSCDGDFDEHLARAVPERSSPAAAMLGEGEAYRVALDTRSEVSLTTPGGAVYSTPLTGHVGYSECRDGSAAGPCAFYLGSLTAAASRSVTMTMECADGTEDRVTLDNLLFSLGQPAFGMAKGGAGEIAKGFPAGGLVFENSFDVDRSHYDERRTNRRAVTMSVDGPTFTASGLVVGIEVPCNASTTQVTATVTLESPADGSTLGAPPAASIVTPGAVACGVATPLEANVTDRDGDVVSTRWLIDGVLMSASTTSVTFTGPHELEVVARDSRGAATTARRSIQCQ